MESFTAPTTIPSTTYYGFQNIVFNQIHVIPAFNLAGGIDNIEFTRAAAVPEPATLALVGFGAITAGSRKRRRNRRRS